LDTGIPKAATDAELPQLLKPGLELATKQLGRNGGFGRGYVRPLELTGNAK